MTQKQIWRGATLSLPSGWLIYRTQRRREREERWLHSRWPSGRKQGRSDLLFVLSAALREKINSEKTVKSVKSVDKEKKING